MGGCGSDWRFCDGLWPDEPKTLPDAYDALRAAVDRMEHQMVKLPKDGKLLKRLDKSVFLMKIAMKIAKLALRKDRKVIALRAA